MDIDYELSNDIVFVVLFLFFVNEIVLIIQVEIFFLVFIGRMDYA